ncbi:MAG: hypothetical protein EDM05_018990 [Leptolyngbya sp. IPPAS B-1204]|nr:hypothetical protein [Elainella sp. C42_A2020_010]RNJ67313.1 MAG: hypothetical protein EDM05_21285 [Leptolyngbya sp. IPPAS B-1204]
MPESNCYEILCLEYQDTALYGEAIQIIQERNLCWLRPLALLQQTQQERALPILYDLRQGSDLLCPHTLIRTALDTEVLPILAQLENLKASCATPVPEPVAHQQLQAFIRKICQAQPDAFRPMHPSS